MAIAIAAAARRGGSYRWAICGMLLARIVGYVLDPLGSSAPRRAIAGGACFAALFALHLHLRRPRLRASRGP